MIGKRLWLALCMLGGTTSAIAQSPVRLDVGQFTLRAETLSGRQRQEIYLQLIENFVGWTEHTGRFVNTEELEPGAGYFNAAGHGVTWARGNSNLCVAYAVLLKAFPQRDVFSIYKVPRSQLEDHLRRTIRALCLSNKNCSRHKSTPAQLGWTVVASCLGNHRLRLGGSSLPGPPRRRHTGNGARGGLPGSGSSGQRDSQPPFRRYRRGGLLLEHAAAGAGGQQVRGRSAGDAAGTRSVRNGRSTPPALLPTLNRKKSSTAGRSRTGSYRRTCIRT